MRGIFLIVLLGLALPATAEAACDARSTNPVVMVVGDSLSAAYGIDADDGWVALLEARLKERDDDYSVVNASVSGDTTSGGLARLRPALERHAPRLVVIELGGNDGLRGLPLKVMERNLEAMIEASRDAGAQIALLGMRIPPNYGRRYAEKFHDLYQTLAARHDLPLVEFFLEGVALDKSLMLADGIHPNAAAQPVLLENAWPAIDAALGVCAD